MTRYLIKPRVCLIVKEYGFLSFAKNMDQNISKNVSSKYSQNLFNHAKHSSTDTLKTGKSKSNRSNR